MASALVDMTAPDIAVAYAGRSMRSPACVYFDGDRMLFGERARVFLTTEPRRVETDPLARIDDEFVVLDRHLVPVGDLVSGLLAHLLEGLAAANADALVVAVPTAWGERRRATLERYASVVVARLTVVRAAEALCAAMGAQSVRGSVGAAAAPQEGRGLDGTTPTVVVERSASAATAALLEYGPAGLNVSGVAVAEMPADDTLVPHMVEGIAQVAGDRMFLPTLVLADGDLVGAIDAGLRERGWTGATVGPLDPVSGENAVLLGLREWTVRRPAPARGAPEESTADFDRLLVRRESDAPARGRVRLFAVAGLAAAIVAAVCVASVLSGRGGSPEPPSDRAAPPAPAAQVVPPVHTVTDGPVTFAAPDGWSVLRRAATGQGSRVELDSPGGASARVVVVQNPLTPGTDGASVAASLRAMVQQHGDRFAHFDARATYAGRPVITYTQASDDGGAVQWHVIVADGTQVSVGCQAPDGDRAGVRTACATVVRSVRPAHR